MRPSAGRVVEMMAGLLIAGTGLYVGVQAVRAYPGLFGPMVALALLVGALWALSILLRIGQALDDRDAADQAEARARIFGDHDPHQDFEPLPRRRR